jgi:uncharacterized membrane protein YkvA (DUF1232 family)
MIRLLVLVALVFGVGALLVPKWRPAALRWARSLLWVGAALLYLRSPIDLIPDTGPVGFIDDLLVLALSLWWARQGGAPQWLRRREQAQATRHRDGHEADQQPSGASEAGEPWDPYQVLEIGPEASAEEITRAYRTQMKRFHPDRVEGLGEELREVAHRRTREIQRAYDELRER